MLIMNKGRLVGDMDTDEDNLTQEMIYSYSAR